MPLTGTYNRSLDDKRRVAVPKQLREQFGADQPTRFYIAPGTDRSLALYSPNAFEELAQRMAEKSAHYREVRNYMRMFYSRAEKVELDSQGRVRIPDRLAEFAHLKREAVLLGVHDHAEIWDRQLWEEFLNKHNEDFDELAGEALG